MHAVPAGLDVVGAVNQGPPDVIIVGSGPAGVSAAWPLVESGAEVLMLDADPGYGLPPPPLGDIGSFRRSKDRFAHRLEEELDDTSPKWGTPLGRQVISGFLAANGIETSGFRAAGSLVRGGLSTVWGAAISMFDEIDTHDYPFRPDALGPSYRRVIDRIGVSGGSDTLRADINLLPPTPLTAALRHVWERHQAATMPSFDLTRAANAVATGPGDRDCQSCGLCLWGCARGSIYCSAAEIPLLSRYSNFAIRRVGPIFEILETPEGYALHNEGGEAASAPRVVLAAGTLATTALTMRHLKHFDESVRLHSNPAAGMAHVVPKLLGAALPDRSFSLAQLAYSVPIDTDHRAIGMLYGADTLPSETFANRLPLSRPTALRAARYLAPALVLATCYLPGSYSRNEVCLERRGGKDMLVVKGHQNPEAAHLLRLAGRRLGAQLRARGAWRLPMSFAIIPPGADGHYAGTIPMGGSQMLACSAQGKVNRTRGLYIADGACLPSLPAKHCTLTIMANADRIGRLLGQTIQEAPN